MLPTLPCAATLSFVLYLVAVSFYLYSGAIYWKTYYSFALWYMYFAHVSLCITCAHGAHGGQKRAQDPLELQLQRLESHHVHARNQFLVLWKDVLYSQLRSYLYSFRIDFSSDFLWGPQAS